MKKQILTLLTLTTLTMIISCKDENKEQVENITVEVENIEESIDSIVLINDNEVMVYSGDKAEIVFIDEKGDTGTIFLEDL